MSDNKNARKKLEQMERARRMDEERRERIKAQRQRGVDTSEGKSILCATIYMYPWQLKYHV